MRPSELESEAFLVSIQAKPSMLIRKIIFKMQLSPHYFWQYSTCGEFAGIHVCAIVHTNTG